MCVWFGKALKEVGKEKREREKKRKGKERIGQGVRRERENVKAKTDPLCVFSPCYIHHGSTFLTQIDTGVRSNKTQNGMWGQ